MGILISFKTNKGFVSNVCYVDIADSVVVIEPGPTYVFAKELNSYIKKLLIKSKLCSCNKLSWW